MIFIRAGQGIMTGKMNFMMRCACEIGNGGCIDKRELYADAA